jgi:hypothetical protein
MRACPAPPRILTDTKDTDDTPSVNAKRQTLSRKRYRETEDTNDTHASALPACVATPEDAIEMSLEKKLGKQTLFLFARALRAMEATTGTKIQPPELPGIFAKWWTAARSKLPAGADYTLYLVNFTAAFRRAKVPLHLDPIEEAILYADANEPRPEFGPVIGRLALACERLQQIAGKDPFYIGVRTAANILNIKDFYSAMNVLEWLVSQGFMRCVEKGAGHRASRFQMKDL